MQSVHKYSNVQKKHKGDTYKREDYIGWEEYFMGIALLGAHRSKDPVTQVGACIVNKDNKIVGSGYNGMPIGCSDDIFSWEKQDKHWYVCHAEMNAIVNKFSTDKDCRVYVTLFPCHECAKIIIQAGIKEVIYLSEKDKQSTDEAKKMFGDAAVSYRKFTTHRKNIVLKFSE